MEEILNRRRFVALTGTAGIVGATGCLGSGEESPDEAEQSSGGDENGEDGSDSEDDGTESEERPEEFDFPPGADENGIVTETVVAGARQFVDEQDRYRTTQTYDLEYSDASTDEIEIAYDVDERLVHERQTRNGVEIDRWVTPDRTVARSVDSEADRTNHWQTGNGGSAITAGGAFNRFPFEEATVPLLLESASFEFDEIVTESEQPYARYTGEIGRSGSLELRQPNSARVDYRMESATGGSVSILLAESGAVRSVEYEFSGEGIRQTHEGRKEVGIETSGEVDFEYDESLDTLEPPEWAETPDPTVTRNFETTRTSLGETYKLVEGPPLSGSLEQEYAEFYLTAQFGSERYMDRYIPRTEFDTREGVVAWLEEDELQLDWASFSGLDAFVEADRIEMSIYLYSPKEGRSLIFHEEYAP